jgi:hypothetical protein
MLYIYPLPRNHNTSLVTAYFELDKRKCECLEYIFKKHELNSGLPRHWLSPISLIAILKFPY